MKNLLNKLFRASAESNDGTWDLFRTAFTGLCRRPRDARGLKLGGLENRLLYSATPVSPDMLLPEENAGVDCDCAVAVELGDNGSVDEGESARNSDWDMGSDSGDLTGWDGSGLLVESASGELQAAMAGSDLLSFDEAQFLIPEDPEHATDAATNELVIVDTSADDYQQLLDDVWSNDAPDRRIDVVLLDRRLDGVQQLSRILSRYENLDAVHIVSHGTDGAVRLGSTWLNAGNMDAYAARVAGWRDALATDADVLFYGCDLAQSDAGRTLVDSISALTGADVTASSDGTGHALLGGDWELEYATGVVETGIAFSRDAQQHWMGLLAAPEATHDPGSFDTTISAMNPVGYWRLGESAATTAVDETATANDGTYNGALPGQAGALAGDADTAVTFDGVDDVVELPHHSSYVLDEGTIQLWFNAQDTTAGHLFSKDAHSFVNGGHLSAYLKPSGQLEVRLQSATASYFVESTPAQPITPGQWHHMAFTFGSEGMKLYVDGQLAATNAYTGGLGTTSGGSGNTEPIALGASTQNSNEGAVDPLQDFFHGSIDEVAVLGTVLTEAQVQDLYAAGIQDYAVDANASLSVTAAAGVLANDFDADGDPLTAGNLDTTATQGLVTLNVDGSFQYDPNGQYDYLQAGQQASDSFTYTADDGSLNSAPATVTITIMGVNDPPVANDDSFSVSEDTSLDVSTSWDLASWEHRRVLSFDNAARSEDLHEFPVLVAIDASRIDYSQTQDQGQDLRFVDGDGTGLAHEIERWDEGGTSYVWVKVPQIDAASADDFVYMYYGNDSAADGQADVWTSDYQAVYHMQPAGGTVTDSSGNAFDGANNGSTVDSGIAGDALRFDGSTQWVDIGSDRPFLNSANAATLSAWIHPDVTSGSGDIVSLSYDGPTVQASRAAINRVGDEIQVIARANDTISGDLVNISTVTSPLTANQWHYVVAVIDYENDSIRVYVDGVEQAMSGPANFSNTSTPNTNSAAAAIGSNEAGANSYFDGRIDEARVADEARSADWIAAQYDSQRDQFVSFGFEQNEGGVLSNDTDADADTLAATNLDSFGTAGQVTLNTDGSFVYDPNGSFDYLGAGQTAVDTFTYTAHDGAVDSGSATVSVTVTGVNDAPEIAAWYDAGWLYRKEIVIDPNQVAADLTDFPVLVDLASDPDLAALAQSDGDDILFTRVDGTTRLSHEIERYESGSGGLSAWVRTDLSASQDTRIYLYFGNASAADQQDITGVWDSAYQGIWHLNQAPTGAADEITDSTLHGNDGTTEGSMTAADLVDARIGKGLDFDEIDDLIRVADSTSLDGTSDAATIEAWAWFEDSADGVHQIIMTSSNRFTPGAKDGYEWASQGDGDHFFYPYGGTDPNHNLGPDPFTSQTWHHVAVTLDFAAKDVAILVDGAPMAFTEEHVPTTWTTLADPADWLWGGNPDRPTRYFDGMFDELRVSDTVRSQSWIQTSVNNQSTPASFHTVGNLESRDATLTDINEDTASPSGDTVAQLIASTGGDRITDADAGASEGIAVAGTDNSHGTWQYSLDNGSNWNNFGPVSDSAAVLLDTAARVRFVPDADYHGPSGNLSYRAWDQTWGSSGDSGVDVTHHGGTSAFSATVDTAHLNVLPVNDIPIASADTLTTNEDTPLVISAASLLGNDTDVDLDLLTIAGVTQPSHGTLTDNGNGTYTYTPSANYEGSDAFTYTVSDGNGGSDSATADITVQGVNDAPLNLVPGAQLSDEDTPLVFSTANGNAITVFDIDAKGSEMEVTLTAVNGAVSLDDTAGLTFSAGDGTADPVMTFRGTVSDLNSALNGLQFLPTADYAGPATLQVTTTDLGNSGAGGPETDIDVIPITIQPVNDPPVAAGDALSTAQDAPLVIPIASLLANDTDIEFDTLSLAGFSPPAHGTLVPNGDGTLTYTPAAGFSGADAFTYTAYDGQATSAPATVTIHVEQPTLSGAIPPDTSGDDPLVVDPDGSKPPAEEPSGDPPADANEPSETRGAVNDHGVAIVRGRFQPGVEVSPILPEAYEVEAVERAEKIEWATIDCATGSLDSATMSRGARNSREFAEPPDYFSIDVHLMWEQLDAFRDKVAWDTGYYTLSAAAATGTFAVLSAGYAAWTVRGGYLLSSVLTALPAWRLMDPLPVLATPVAAAHVKSRTSSRSDETLQTLTSGQAVTSTPDVTVSQSKPS